MASVVEIRCPECGNVRDVRKIAVGRYRCDDCGHEFETGDVMPDEA
jgi:ribosomal protein L37AE/L43A